MTHVLRFSFFNLAGETKRISLRVSFSTPRRSDPIIIIITKFFIHRLLSISLSHHFHTATTNMMKLVLASALVCSAAAFAPAPIGHCAGSWTDMSRS
jgi:membrane protein insertase Oxa1/YidC/SpoIIIJ